MEQKKVVQNSENPKVVFLLFETVKLSILISPRNLYNYFIEKHKRLKKQIHTLKRVWHTCFEEICTSMHVHFIIFCFVYHGLNQILEYKDIPDIPSYLFYSFVCLCMYLYIHKQNSCRAMKDTINNIGCKTLHDRVDHSMRNIWISTSIQHDSTCKLEWWFFYILLFLTGRSRNEMSP